MREAPAVAPVDGAAFAAAMAACARALPPDGPLAVAVSGGADSLALLRLLQPWAIASGRALVALTVDHRLRPASATEAREVAAWCAGLGLRHETLVWTGAPVAGASGSLQSAARAARYALLLGWCRGQGAAGLCVAHHADDQIETFLMRLARGSGLEGLTAMLPVSVRDGVALLRPLLAFPKAALIATCRSLGQAWIEDPSNANAVSQRVRFRQARGVLQREGLSDARLLQTIGHLQRAQAAIGAAVDAVLAASCAWDDFGCATLARAGWRDAPEEVQLRALARILNAVSGADYGPRFARLAALAARLRSGGPALRKLTLHGCVIRVRADAIHVMREAAAIADTRVLEPGGAALWDGRFAVGLASTAPGPVRVTRAADMTLPRAGATRLAPALRETLPVFSDDDGPVAIPPLGWVREDGASRWKADSIRCSFRPAARVADLPPPGSM